MIGNIDDLKGKAKQVVGDLTDDGDLQRAGNADKAASKVKDKIDDAKD